MVTVPPDGLQKICSEIPKGSLVCAVSIRTGARPALANGAAGCLRRARQGQVARGLFAETGPLPALMLGTVNLKQAETTCARISKLWG
jgi:hypothetical protein